MLGGGFRVGGMSVDMGLKRVVGGALQGGGIRSGKDPGNRPCASLIVVQ